MVISIRFASVCRMDTKSGFLSLDNLKTAVSSIQRQPKLEALQGMTYCVSSSVFRQNNL